MALTSRRQRDLEQRRRMARGRRNLSQLAGPVAQGQRTPMNRGHGSVSTVEAPKFQQSNIGNDIAQAGLAYKGAKGINEFAMGKEAYTDAAGNYIKAREPWTISDKPIFGEGGHVDPSKYFQDVGQRGNEAIEGAKGLFGTPTPQPSATPTNMNPGFNVSDINKQSGGPLSTQAQFKTYGPNTMLNNNMSPPPGLEQELASGGQNVENLLDVGAGNMSSGGSGASNLSSLLGSGTHASQAGNIFAPAGSFGTTGGSVLHQGGGSLGGTSAAGGEAVAGADAASGASGQPWMAYANIAKDLFVGGPGSEKITGSTAGDAAIRAAAAYFTFGLSEIPYALF
jgi:hypothetical protein